MLKMRNLPPLHNLDTDKQVDTAVPGNLDDHITIKVNDQTFIVYASELVKIADLGRGAFGVVEKMHHKPSNTTMAVKRIPCSGNNQPQDMKRTNGLMDLYVSMRVSACPYTVHFYGAMFREGDVWICLEVMDMSLDKFYSKAYNNKKIVSENIIGRIIFSVVSALHYLYSKLNVIHRDVKPSNMLINRKGEVKMCDFGISGHLVDSFAKTVDVGCKMYMAPERIDPKRYPKDYDIRSDVWSLGISLIEIATGKFPYSTWDNCFEQLKQVVGNDPPRLPSGQFSPDFEDFITLCLKKDYNERPDYDALLGHKFCKKHGQNNINETLLIQEILDLPEHF